MVLPGMALLLHSAEKQLWATTIQMSLRLPMLKIDTLYNNNNNCRNPKETESLTMIVIGATVSSILCGPKGRCRNDNETQSMETGTTIPTSTIMPIPTSLLTWAPVVRPPPTPVDLERVNNALALLISNVTLPENFTAMLYPMPYDLDTYDAKWNASNASTNIYGERAFAWLVQDNWVDLDILLDEDRIILYYPQHGRNDRKRKLQNKSTGALRQTWLNGADECWWYQVSCNRHGPGQDVGVGR
jgi:hypothetical protein